MPWQPGYPVQRILSSLKYFAPPNFGLMMKKRSPRREANVDPFPIMAALAASPAQAEWETRRNQFYHSKAWKDLRNATRSAAGGMCRRCRTPCSINGHAHHILRLRTNWLLRLDPTNIEWLCGPCHRREHGLY